MIASFGGSLGAEKINSVMTEFINNYSSKSNQIVHYHATGRKNFKEDPFIKSFEEMLNVDIYEKLGVDGNTNLGEI